MGRGSDWVPALATAELFQSILNKLYWRLVLGKLGPQRQAGDSASRLE
jgi:hypothetical protein